MSTMFMVTGRTAGGRITETAWAFSQLGAEVMGQWLMHPDRDVPAHAFKVERTEQHAPVHVKRLVRGIPA